MPTATWNGTVIADASDEAVEIVEGNVYFPMDAVRSEFLRPSDSETVCHWKGHANYFDVVTGGKINKDAAWTYREPLDAARQIAGFVAFWHGVEVQR